MKKDRKFLGHLISDFELIADMIHDPITWAKAKHETEMVDVVSNSDNGFISFYLDLGLMPVVRPLAYEFYLNLRYTYNSYVVGGGKDDLKRFGEYIVYTRASTTLGQRSFLPEVLQALSLREYFCRSAMDTELAILIASEVIR